MFALDARPIIQQPCYRTPEEYISLSGGAPQDLPDDFELITNGVMPSHVKWKRIQLYNIDATGNRRVWQIGFDGIKMWTLHGTYNTTRIDTREVTTNCSGRDLLSQALLETANYFKRKIQRGYYPAESDFKPKLVGMKGVHLKPNSKIDWSRGMIADTKLDGLRMVTQVSNGKVSLRSNANESYDHLTHIKEELDEFIHYLPPNCVIDGELYNKGMTLPEINSAVRTHITFNPESLKIAYYIFDLDWETKPCSEERYEVIRNAYSMFHADRTSRGLTVRALTYTEKRFIYSYEECIYYLGIVIRNGYEGLMLRHPGRNAVTNKQKQLAKYVYGPSRTVALYKVKTFITEEAPVVGVIAGQGKDSHLGILQLLDQVTGTIITIRWGTDFDRAGWLRNPECVIGRIFQYKYAFRDKNSRAPNQPSGVGWRDVYY